MSFLIYIFLKSNYADDSSPLKHLIIERKSKKDEFSSFLISSNNALEDYIKSFATNEDSSYLIPNTNEDFFSFKTERESIFCNLAYAVYKLYNNLRIMGLNLITNYLEY